MPSTEGALLLQGLWLMAAGMSSVFVFLLLLVGVLSLMSAFARRLAPPAALEPRPSDAPTNAVAVGAAPELQRAAAIAAAIHHLRSRRQS